MMYALPRRIGHLHLLLISAAILCLALSSLTLHAEVKVLHIDPQATDASIRTVHAPHIALYDPQIPSNHKLFLFFVGTHASPEFGLPIDTAFTKMGYHAITLDYESDISAAAACAQSKDDACFEHYHNAILKGEPGTDKVTVSPENSALNRLQKLLAYLMQQDPEGGWGEFVSKGQPVWSRVVVAGHSQGAGHAAYIANLFKVDRALIFSGPQEYYTDLDKPAPWQSRPSATPASRYFAFLSLNDPTIEPHQLTNCLVLMHLSKPPEIPTVEPGQPIHGNYRILVNNVEKKHAHNSTASVDYQNVWEYFSALP